MLDERQFNAEDEINKIHAALKRMVDQYLWHKRSRQDGDRYHREHQLELGFQLRRVCSDIDVTRRIIDTDLPALATENLVFVREILTMVDRDEVADG